MVTDSDKKYSICVYCASGPVDESFLALAAEVGTAIGRRGWQLVSGGGDVDADELIVTDTMRERKKLMEDHADAFITLPGGIGTLEELFETWTAGYLGMHEKPVVMLDPVGHFTGLLEWLNKLDGTGFVGRQALDTLLVRTDVEAALDACVRS
jgi:predicted Rossmann-fold nucleotide-binding protein